MLCAVFCPCGLCCVLLQTRGRNLFHAGMARGGGYVLGSAAAGDVAAKAMESGKGNYLANLVLYPGEWSHFESVWQKRVRG